jgi:hypothetical protein
LGGSLIANKQAQNSADQGLQQAGQANSNALRAQQGLTRQQLELNRPLIQTRDNALNQLNEFFGLPTSAPSSTSGGQENLIALPGIKFQVSKGKKGSHTAADLLGAFSSPDQQGESVGQVYFDQSSGTFVDGAGNLLANAPPGGGVVPGLVHGSDNQVSVGPDGSITSIGSRGQVQLAGIPKLVKSAAVQGTQAATQGKGPDFSNILNLPIFDYQRKQGEGVINRNLAGQGKFFSGQRGQALLGFNNQLVANRINEDYVQPRLTLAGFGNQASANSQNALNNAGQNIGQAGATSADIANARGNTRASGYLAQGDALGQFGQNLLTRRTQTPDYNYTGKTDPLPAYLRKP